jgi:ceramide glucosyltransferase
MVQLNHRLLTCMWLFYFSATVLICLSTLYVIGIFGFVAYVREQLASQPPDFCPFASIIVPCRGADEGMKQNLTALFAQAYPQYEVIFVTGAEDDPSLDIIRELVVEYGKTGKVSTRTVIAGKANDSGQKVHNLRSAVREVSAHSEVLVFVDTDGRPNSSWLRSLVGPLAEETIGASTGYRWFVPATTSLSSQLRSVWNASIASALGPKREKNFCWGGSTAIRRSTFDKLNMQEHWRATVSDDFALTRALNEAKLPIHFAPACLVPASDSCSFRQLLEFTDRQLKITRVYATHLWKQVMLGSLFFCAVFFGGLVIVSVRAMLGAGYVVPLLMIVLIYILGTLRSFFRFLALSRAIQNHSGRLWASLPAHLILWPIASALFLWNSLVAAFSQRITWRGITYDLSTPGKTIIISRS